MEWLRLLPAARGARGEAGLGQLVPGLLQPRVELCGVHAQVLTGGAGDELHGRSEASDTTHTAPREGEVEDR